MTAIRPACRTIWSCGGGAFVFSASLASAQIQDARGAIAHARSLLTHATRSEEWKRLTMLLERPVFTGADTLDGFEEPVLMQVDLAFVCPAPRAVAVRLDARSLPDGRADVCPLRAGGQHPSTPRPGSAFRAPMSATASPIHSAG